MIRAPDLAPSNTCRSIHLDTLQHVRHVPVRSVAVGCSFGFTTLTITIEMLKPRSHIAGMAAVHPGGGQPVYRDEPGHFC